MKKIIIEGYECVLSEYPGSSEAIYLIYPAIVPFEDKWIQRMSEIHQRSLVVVYVPADKWNDALTPWPEPGEAPGCEPFGGNGATFLKLLQDSIIPESEKALTSCKIESRDLMGVSLGGLFTLWQWMKCSVFRSIACLSGSFWYVGFLEWFEKQPVPKKDGKAYFLLGEEEPHSHVKAFQSVGVNTEAVVKRLKDSGIEVTFEWVPGNHFSKPVHRAERGLEALCTQ